MQPADTPTSSASNTNQPSNSNTNTAPPAASPFNMFGGLGGAGGLGGGLDLSQMQAQVQQQVMCL